MHRIPVNLVTGFLGVGKTTAIRHPLGLHPAGDREYPNFQDQIHLADVLVANKRDLYTASDLVAFERFARALRPAKHKIGCVANGDVDPRWLDLGRTGDRQAAFPEAHAFLVRTGATAAPAHSRHDHDWLLVEGDGYRRAGWLIRQGRAWPDGALLALVDRPDMERRKGLFLTQRGWLALNQAQWSTAGVPADGLSRLQLIDPQPIDVAAVDGGRRRLADGA